jgi:hypothetical protein
MFQLLDPVATLDPTPTTTAAATAASNTAVVLTIAAVPGYRHYLVQLIWSYNATPTAGRLTIAGTKGADIDFDITVSGPGPANFPPMAGDVNTAMVVTLAAAGGGVTGKLNAVYVSLPAVFVHEGSWLPR